MYPITLDKIKEAQKRIQPYVLKTPLFPFDYIKRVKGKDVHLKCENLQITGSYKIRGATNCILNNIAQAKKCGVVAASLGNHAQGVAAICNRLGVKSTICMPIDTPVIKTQNTAQWGATIKLVGHVLDDSFAHAQKLADEKGFLLVPPFGHPDVLAGQGTIGLELIEQESFKDVEAVIVPVGGGGLITGISSVLKAVRPDIKIYGVTATNVPATWKSFHTGEKIEEAVKRTLAEGVAVKKRDNQVIPYLKDTLEDLFHMEEENIAYGIAVMAERSKLILEGASSLTIAAILDDRIPENNICAVLSGGNIDLPTLSRVLRRGLVEQERLIRLNIVITDRPGGLAEVTKQLADSEANIIHIFHKRNTVNVSFGDTLVEVELETKGSDHTKRILGELRSKGYSVHRVF